MGEMITASREIGEDCALALFVSSTLNFEQIALSRILVAELHVWQTEPQNVTGYSSR